MPARPHPKRAVTLDGLYFSPGRPFSSMAAAERIYGLLLGPIFSQGTQSIEEVRPRVVMILTAIFRLCLARVAIFVALNDSALGWQIVAGDVAEQHKCSISPADVEEIVCVFARARRDYLDRQQPLATPTPATELMNLMDRWNDAVRQDEPAGEVSSEVTTLAARPAPPAPIENLLAGFGLRDDGPSAPPAATTNTPWPPAHLAPADAQLLKYPRVQAQLAGVNWRDKGQMPPFPGEKTDPLGLRVWLGWLAAAHTPPPPNNTFALFAAPVAFFTNKDRQAWYEESGCQSKMFGHVDGFLEYAAEAFKGGKTMVLGLATPIFPTVGEARTYANTSGKPALEVFNNHANLRRFGTAVMIRIVERNGAHGLQLAFFCPWDRHQYVKNSWKVYDSRVRMWKDKMIAAVEGWAAKNKVAIHDGYSGGSIIVRKDRDHDSVEMCAGWLLRAVTATKKTIPGDKEEDDWEWEEVCFFKQLRNWVRVEEEEDGQMDVDTDL